MKTLLLQVLAGVLVCGFSLAQSTTATPGLPAQQSRAGQPDPSNSRKATETLRIAPGGVIPAQLTKSLDAKKVKTGDEIEAKVTQDLKSENGAVIVPKDTKVLGMSRKRRLAVRTRKSRKWTSPLTAPS